jgi:hypothetical protein
MTAPSQYERQLQAWVTPAQSGKKTDIKFTAVLPLYQANLVFGAEFTPTSDSSCN